jgi:hypothetical protein
MDKASILRDAIAYIERLQEEERRMLAEISALEYSSAVVVPDAADSFPWPKKPRLLAPADDGACTSSQPVRILEVIIYIYRHTPKLPQTSSSSTVGVAMVTIN